MQHLPVEVGGRTSAMAHISELPPQSLHRHRACTCATTSPTEGDASDNPVEQALGSLDRRAGDVPLCAGVQERLHRCRVQHVSTLPYVEAGAGEPLGELAPNLSRHRKPVLVVNAAEDRLQLLSTNNSALARLRSRSATTA